MTSKRPRGIDFLNTLPLWSGSLDFSLANPVRLMDALGNPQDRARSVHIAGTNGKGSTAAFVAAMLRSTGYSVAQFASPHLTKVTERCIVNGLPIAEDLFADAIDRVVAIAAEINVPLTYFELTTAASFVACAALQIEWLVVEVGLGGRLDATNVLRAPAATAITSISFDHMHVLGNTLAAIAKEKAGIIKSAVPCYVGRVTDEVYEAISASAREKGASAYFLGQDFDYDSANCLIEIRGQRFPLDLKSDALRGEHQVDNATVAATLALEVGLSVSVIERGVKAVRWPGRLEYVQTGQLNILLDAAHNPDGMRTLLSFIETYLNEQSQVSRIVFVASFLETKNWRAMVALQQEFAEKMLSSRLRTVDVWYTKSNHAQAVPPEQISEYCVDSCPVTGQQVTCYDTATLVVNKLHSLSQKEETLVVIAGSIYLLGEIYPLLGIADFQTVGNPCQSPTA